MSARFSSTFSNVSTGDYNDPRWAFQNGNQRRWQPWPYSGRLKVS